MQKSIVWHLTKKEILVSSALQRAIGVVTFIILTAAGAFVYLPLPFTPVPITMQTFFVLLCAAFLKPNDSLIAQGAYLGLGLSGFPIFSAASGGLIKLSGPTGGYIVGFIFSVFIVSRMLNIYRDKNQLSYFRILTFFVLGIVTIYLFGGLWLAFIMRFSLVEVLSLGVAPFIAGDILKITLAAFIYSKASKRIKYIFHG